MGKRKKHTNKETEAAIQAAIDAGWSFEEPKGGNAHRFGYLKCPANKDCRGGRHCYFNIRSTPKNREGQAKRILRAVNGCEFKQVKRENDGNAGSEDTSDV